MNKGKTVILYIIILIAILAMFCGTAYSYYKRVIVKDEANVTIKTINLLVEYDKGSKINLNNIKFDEEYTHELNIINDSEDEIGKYKLQFEIITPFSKSIDENFIYDLVCESESQDNINKLINISNSVVPVANKEIGEATITPNNTHTCKFIFKVLNKNQENGYLKNKIFVAKIKVLSSNK